MLSHRLLASLLLLLQGVFSVVAEPSDKPYDEIDAAGYINPEELSRQKREVSSADTKGQIFVHIKSQNTEPSESNLCSDDPCGPNSECWVSESNFRCTCADGFTGTHPDCQPPQDDDITTIVPDLGDESKFTGCVNQSDCPSNLACVNQYCVNPCENRCGPNADCKVYDHYPSCSCPANYTGNPYLYCSEIGCVNQSDCSSDLACVNWNCVNPCENRCGPNANCKVYDHYPSCICPTNYTGNPFYYCYEIDDVLPTPEQDLCDIVKLGINSLSENTTFTDCVDNNDCPSDGACICKICVNPCENRCGPNANCQVYNHYPSCTCPTNYTGNPYLYCSEIDNDITTTVATVPDLSNDVDMMADNSTNTGCVSQSDCPSNLACVNQICVNPCENRCGRNANCEVYDHYPSCTCPANYTGNPFLYCSEIGCVNQNDCPSDLACVNWNCVNPCENRCGQNANCKVHDHYPSCTCPTNYTGNPYLYCSAIDDVISSSVPDFCDVLRSGINSLSEDNTFTECADNSDCPSDGACICRTCVNPCENRCGPNAECKVYNNYPSCTCPTNYTGNPYLYCSEIGAAATVSPDNQTQGFNAVVIEDQMNTTTEDTYNDAITTIAPETENTKDVKSNVPRKG